MGTPSSNPTTTGCVASLKWHFYIVLASKDYSQPWPLGKYTCIIDKYFNSIILIQL